MRDVVVIAVSFAILALLTVISYQDHYRFHRPMLTTPYQAVTLTNGAVLYGRLYHLGSDHPVLRDVFTVRHQPGSPTQQYVLVKRKDEVNGADHVIFPVTSILFVEPVNPDSAIGQLIAAADVSR